MCTEGAGVCGFLAVGEGGEFSRLLHRHLRPFDTHPTWPPETQSPQCYPCQVLTCQFWETKVELGSFLSIWGDPAGSLSGLAWLTPCFLVEQFSLCIYEKAGWSGAPGLVHLPRSPLEQPMGSRQGSSPTTHKHNENVLRYVTGDFFIIPLTLQRFLIYSIVPSVCWQKIQRLGLNSMTKHVKNTRADKKSDAQEGLGFGTVDIWERQSE